MKGVCNVYVQVFLENWCPLVDVCEGWSLYCRLRLTSLRENFCWFDKHHTVIRSDYCGSIDSFLSKHYQTTTPHLLSRILPHFKLNLGITVLESISFFTINIFKLCWQMRRSDFATFYKFFYHPSGVMKSSK